MNIKEALAHLAMTIAELTAKNAALEHRAHGLEHANEALQEEVKVYRKRLTEMGVNPDVYEAGAKAEAAEAGGADAKERGG